MVAVGTSVTRRPPHGSVREELPHTALAADAASTPVTDALMAGVAHNQAVQFRRTRHWVRKRWAARLFSLADGLPSLPSADSLLPALVRTFRRYYATVRLPSNVHVGRTAHGLRQPARALPATGVPGVSRFSRLVFPRMPRVYDPAGSGSRLKLSPTPMLPSAPATWASPPRTINDFGAQYLACVCPCQRFTRILTAAGA